MWQQAEEQQTFWTGNVSSCGGFRFILLIPTGVDEAMKAQVLLITLIISFFIQMCEKRPEPSRQPGWTLRSDDVRKTVKLLFLMVIHPCRSHWWRFVKPVDVFYSTEEWEDVSVKVWSAAEKLLIFFFLFWSNKFAVISNLLLGFRQ